MSFIASLRDRARRRKTAPEDWCLPKGTGPEDAQARLAAEVAASLAPRRVILSGPAGRVVLEAGQRRLFRATLEPADGPETGFGPGAQPFGPGFRAALDTMLAGGGMTIAYDHETGPFPDAGGIPSAEIFGSPQTGGGQAGTGRPAQFLTAVQGIADHAVPLAMSAPDTPGALDQVLNGLVKALGGDVLCVILPTEAEPEPARAVAYDGNAGTVATLPRNRLGPLLRAWEAAGRDDH